ncbi:MAG: hypothetical protein ALECFALPRED_003212 [Alectoria fallacina]|uniref:Uncharacterized protein n=1 Tax=Alectoria fallacina TaxID=1903189 RepID=A0A8H3ISG1_9LECA|nr:MAG: hypothetical protein ALECFALPRED_003212 [Alectoria fallacina]
MDERVEDSDDNVSVEDSDDNISVEDSDIDDSGDEAESAPGPEAQTVNRRGEIEMMLRCAISIDGDYNLALAKHLQYAVDQRLFGIVVSTAPPKKACLWRRRQ